MGCYSRGKLRTTTIPLCRLVMFNVVRRAALDFEEVVEAATRDVHELALLIRLGMHGAAQLVHEM
jgi:hypothetical protein